jgi:uncharacterized membrane protein YphA (DoxX/SURF4 family)
MLACERWTLTHSSGWAAVLVGLEVALALALLLGLLPALALLLAGLLPALATMSASREAETGAVGEPGDDEPCDDDGDAEPV